MKGELFKKGIQIPKILWRFDQHIIGVSPDYQIKVKEDVLREKDGPMLKHGIQELQDQKLILPKSKKAWPKQEFLDVRYQEFKRGI